MLSLNFNPFPIITTQRLVLRQITINDLDEVFRMRSDEIASQYITRPVARKPEEAEAHIIKISKAIADNESIVWGITMKGEAKIMGAICLFNIKKEDYRAEVGSEMIRDYWRKGTMQEALMAVIAYGFKTIKLHSIEAIADPDNTPSIKLLEKNAFVKEAHLKENYFHKGVFKDTVIYSLLNPE